MTRFHKESCLYIDHMIESTGGGSMRHVIDLHSELIKRGHSSRLIVSTMRAEPEVLDWLGGLDPSTVIKADTHRAPHPSDIPLVFYLRRKLRADGGHRILHAHSTKAGILALMLRQQVKATVLTPHAYRGMDPSLGRFKKGLIALAERSFTGAADHVIAVSPEEVAYARSLSVSENDVSYVPNGIDVTAIRRTAEEGRADRDHSAPIIGFAGRMTRQKNPILFLETCKELQNVFPDLRAIMIGDGDLMREVFEKRAELGLEHTVEMLGALNFSREMHRMDIMVHTSLYESLPYILLEAAAGGLAIVSVRNAGSEAIWPTADLSEHSPQALARSILPLLSSEARLKNARFTATQAAERFSITSMTDSIENVYRKVLLKSLSLEHKN